MKVFPVTISAQVHLTTDMIRSAIGAEALKQARREAREEASLDLARIIRRSPVAACEAAIRNVVDAVTRYEAGKGTRDEMPSLAKLEAACVGLRAAHRNFKTLAAELASKDKEN